MLVPRRNERIVMSFQWHSVLEVSGPWRMSRHCHRWKHLGTTQFVSYGVRQRHESCDSQSNNFRGFLDTVWPKANVAISPTFERLGPIVFVTNSSSSQCFVKYHRPAEALDPTTTPLPLTTHDAVTSHSSYRLHSLWSSYPMLLMLWWIVVPTVIDAKFTRWFQ